MLRRIESTSRRIVRDMASTQKLRPANSDEKNIMTVSASPKNLAYLEFTPDLLRKFIHILMHRSG